MSDITDQIVWKAGPTFSNYWKGRNGNQVVAIVNHIMVGTMETTDSWFNNAASQVSAHFGVAKDGRLWQWVNTHDSAWANGIVKQPDMSVTWLAQAVNANVNPNLLTVSIEHEGNPGDVFPEPQYQTTLALQRYLLATYNLPADRQHIIGHYQIDLIDKKDCPGPTYIWDRLMRDLATTATPPKPVLPPPDGFVVVDANTWRCVATNQTLGNRARDFWLNHGGTQIFGNPLTDWQNEKRSDGTTKSVKYFDRARFELRPGVSPTTPADQCFDLGLIGGELLAAKGTAGGIPAVVPVGNV